MNQLLLTLKLTNPKLMKRFIPIILMTTILMSCQTKPSGNDDSSSKVVEVMFEEIWRTDSIMKVPESVLHDAKRDVLYVANMNRNEAGEEIGFISKLKTDGTVIELHWIDGLIEPRGMGIY